MKVKKRLDVLLTERMFAETRSKAQAIIMSGNVYVNGQKADKPGNEAVYMFYDIEVENAKKISNNENKFSATGMLVADCFAKDICTEKSYYAKIIYYKAKASGNFELSFGNDPSVQNMEFEALAGGCDGNGVLWDFIVFDEDDAIA